MPAEKSVPVRDIVEVRFKDSGADGVRVFCERLTLSNKDSVLRYVTDLPFRNDAVSRPSSRPLRKEDGSFRTQLEFAKDGIITPEMEYVALRESAACLETFAEKREFAEDCADFNLTGGNIIEFDRNTAPVTPEFVRSEIAAGHAVIPCNRLHPESEPMIIGKNFLTKVNANIGASALSSGFEAEIEKLKLSVTYGADTVMDLTVGIDDPSSLRSAVLRNSPVPIGTVPVYEALDRVQGVAGNLTWDVFRQTVIDQAEQGVDYFTIHAGLTADLLPKAAGRLMGIVSRGGGIMASQMLMQNAENIAYEHFDELIAICKKYDVSLSLGDGLRPGAIYDACDEAQYGELRNLGKLAAKCFEAGVQCFIEGPGHVPLHLVEENQRLEEEICHGAPFYTLGPLVTDIGAGFDHITSAVGGCNIAMHGTAMLCYVTPSEHLALPDAEDVKQGLITYKIAAHAADLAKGIKRAYNLDHAMSRARAEFRWSDQFALSFDPEHARKVWQRSLNDEECAHEVSYCSMCGPRFCPIRLNRRLKLKFGV